MTTREKQIRQQLKALDSEAERRQMLGCSPDAAVEAQMKKLNAELQQIIEALYWANKSAN